MRREDILKIKKDNSTEEWTIETHLKMKDFFLEDYGHTIDSIHSDYLEKVKDKYKDKCGKIEFKFSQCVPKVTITGDCSGKFSETKTKSLEHEIIKESIGKLTNPSKKIEDTFFTEYLKNGITIHVIYDIKDCEPPKVAPPLPPGPKPVPSKDCKYEALYKIIFNGPCEPYDSKLSDTYYYYLGQINKNIPKKYKDVNFIEVVKPSIDDKVSTDILKEGKGIIFHGGSKIGGSSFGKRKSIMKKKNPKNKVYKKRFSKC